MVFYKVWPQVFGDGELKSEIRFRRNYIDGLGANTNQVLESQVQQRYSHKERLNLLSM